jgi:tetratricopeptide (TPR) repeat protein
MAKKKARALSPAALARPPLPLLKSLDEADELIRRKKLFEARELLDSLDRRYPNRPEVLGLLVNVNYDLKDMVGYQRAAERLIRIQPNDPDLAIGLGGVYLSNMRPLLALRAFRSFLERFPGHPRAAEVRKTIADLEPGVEQLLSEGGLEGPDRYEIAELHEQLQSALGQGEFPQVRRLAEQLLKRKPDFAPALNNLAMAYLMEGKLAQAIATERRVLEFDPGNIHALANLVIYHCRLGRIDDARAWAEQLKQSGEPAADRALKVAEALSFLGDDEGVLETFQAAQREGDIDQDRSSALLFHLAAVATMRLGREAEARRYWQRALKLSPGLELARGNLDDMRRPVGERNAPWPFAFGNWVARQTIEDLGRQTAGKSNDQALASAIRRFLEKHPDIAALVPILLDRGDEQGRQIALMLAQTSRSPELLAALRDFALSQRGPDKLRHQAAQAADAAGLLPDRKARMWVGGQWQDLLLLGFEVTGEPEGTLGPLAEPLMIRGMEALRNRNGLEAEQWLRQALEVAPESPSLLNNLAMALEQQGRREEAQALTREIHERYPDYLFARVALARTHMIAGDLDAAEELLKPMFMKRRLHFTEAAALFGAQVDLYTARGDIKAARTWLDMWADIEPDSPEVARRRLALTAGGGLKRLLSRRR